MPSGQFVNLCATRRHYTQYIPYTGVFQTFLDTSDSTAQPQEAGLSQTKDPARVITVKACFSGAVTGPHRAVQKLMHSGSLQEGNIVFLPRLPKVLNFQKLKDLGLRLGMKASEEKAGK